jgi:hypothetical protein
LDAGTVEKQYINPEEPYIAEMSDFVKAAEAHNQSLFPNTLLDDHKILQTLRELEHLCGAQ